MTCGLLFSYNCFFCYLNWNPFFGRKGKSGKVSTLCWVFQLKLKGSHVSRIRIPWLGVLLDYYILFWLREDGCRAQDNRLKHDWLINEPSLDVQPGPAHSRHHRARSCEDLPKKTALTWSIIRPGRPYIWTPYSSEAYAKAVAKRLQVCGTSGIFAHKKVSKVKNRQIDGNIGWRVILFL